MKTKSVILNGLLTLVFVLTTVFAQAGVKEEKRNVGDFESVKISGAFDVELIPSSKEYVVVECEDDYIDRVETEVIDDVLKIYLNKRISKLSNGIHVKVYFKDIESIKTSGAVDVKSKGTINLDSFEIYSSGATEMTLDLIVGKLDADFSGASEINFTGKAGKVEMEVSGATEIEALDFIIRDLELDVSGASETEIHVTGRLEAEVSGASSLRYKGNPKDVQIDKSGVSSVREI